MEEEPDIRQLRLDYERATHELALERERSAEQTRHVYVATLDRLLREGRISSVDRPALLDAGAPAGYSLSLLAPFERIPTGTAVPIGRLARTGARAQPPAIEGGSSVSDRRATEIARSFRS